MNCIWNASFALRLRPPYSRSPGVSLACFILRLFRMSVWQWSFSRPDNCCWEEFWTVDFCFEASPLSEIWFPFLFLLPLALGRDRPSRQLYWLVAFEILKRRCTYQRCRHLFLSAQAWLHLFPVSVKNYSMTKWLTDICRLAVVLNALSLRNGWELTSSSVQLSSNSQLRFMIAQVHIPWISPVAWTTSEKSISQNLGSLSNSCKSRAFPE